MSNDPTTTCYRYQYGDVAMENKTLLLKLLTNQGWVGKIQKLVTFKLRLRNKNKHNYWSYKLQLTTRPKIYIHRIYSSNTNFNYPMKVRRIKNEYDKAW